MFKKSTQYLQIKFLTCFIYCNSFYIYMCLKTYFANKNMEFYIFIMIEPYIIYSTVCLSFRHFELNTFINLNVLVKTKLKT